MVLRLHNCSISKYFLCSLNTEYVVEIFLFLSYVKVHFELYSELSFDTEYIIELYLFICHAKMVRVMSVFIRTEP